MTDMLARLGQHCEKLVIEETERVLRVVQVVDYGQAGVLGLEVLFEFFPGLGGEFLWSGDAVSGGEGWSRAVQRCRVRWRSGCVGMSRGQVSTCTSTCPSPERSQHSDTPYGTSQADLPSTAQRPLRQRSLDVTPIPYHTHTSQRFIALQLKRLGETEEGILTTMSAIAPTCSRSSSLAYCSGPTRRLDQPISQAKLDEGEQRTGEQDLGAGLGRHCGWMDRVDGGGGDSQGDKDKQQILIRGQGRVTGPGVRSGRRGNRARGITGNDVDFRGISLWPAARS